MHVNWGCGREARKEEIATPAACRGFIPKVHTRKREALACSIFVRAREPFQLRTGESER